MQNLICYVMIEYVATALQSLLMILHSVIFNILCSCNTEIIRSTFS